MDMLPMLEKDIVDLVQDADPIKRILLAIKDDLTPGLIEALLAMSTIEDQALQVKKAQRNLTDREAWMIRKDSNKREAKELAQLINGLNKSSATIELELSRLRSRRTKLEKELEEVKIAIEKHESSLAHIPDTIKLKK